MLDLREARGACPRACHPSHADRRLPRRRTRMWWTSGVPRDALLWPGPRDSYRVERDDTPASGRHPARWLGIRDRRRLHRDAARRAASASNAPSSPGPARPPETHRLRVQAGSVLTEGFARPPHTGSDIACLPLAW